MPILLVINGPLLQFFSFKVLSLGEDLGEAPSAEQLRPKTRIISMARVVERA
jgi:hypothetical protein